MARFNLKVHETRKRGDRVQTVAVNPYVRFGGPEGGVIYLQHGQFWSEGGDKIDPVPDWALDQANKLSDTVKKEVGYGQPSGDARISSDTSDVGHPALDDEFSDMTAAELEEYLEANDFERPSGWSSMKVDEKRTAVRDLAGEPDGPNAP